MNLDNVTFIVIESAGVTAIHFNVPGGHDLIRVKDHPDEIARGTAAG